MHNLHVLIDGMQIARADGTGLKHYALSVLRAHKALGIRSSALYETHQTSSAYLNALLLAEGTVPSQKQSRKWNRWFFTASGIGSPIQKMDCDFSRIMERERPKLQDLGSYSLTTCYKDAGSIFRKHHRSLLASFPEKLDFWHSTFPLPLNIKGVKKITTIHDLIALRVPNVTLTDKRSKYRLLKESIDKSQVLIAVSEQTKHDILDYFSGVPEEKIHVTHMTPSIGELPNSETVRQTLDCLNLEQDNYLLFLANIEPKKNIRRLLDAYATLDTSLPLVIAGKKAWLYEQQIARLGYDKKLASRVRCLGYVPDEYRAPLYMGARCFVFPSLCEGFGIPPLDALHCGCPVVASDIPAHREVCGPAAHYIDPYDIRSLAEGIEKVSNDAEYRRTLIEKGHQQAALFSLEKHASALALAYRAILAA